MTGADAGIGTPPVDAGALDVVVVGGGRAGLAIAWHLAQRGLHFVATT